ncbi:adenosylcobinamide amidohydrolase [Desulfobulbus rhabdoformis]|uniref:adenosylcobinamide amidohydrolase n=1 Tax=Desulfobulbus rhabdoformis TaxID=34032 RepID=UPI00196361C1|nr:adenosylcobinamide amidohydrolase [Desulfobulbus rhabdoformis]MBM9614823.1 adenosylcobinamide amidohydrolase [Desulfobulbus rhabdoformis]
MRQIAQRTRPFHSWLLVLVLLTSMATLSLASDYPLTITDSLGRDIHFKQPPQRIVCLISSVTDLLMHLHQENLLVGITQEDLLTHARLRVTSMGSFFEPDPKAIEAARPDLIIGSTRQQQLLAPWLDDPHASTKVLLYKETTLAAGFTRMENVGRLVDCAQAAQTIIQTNREQIKRVQDRLKKLPPEQRKRVARVIVGKEILYSPGDDSFQNEMISAAGGLPPRQGKNGSFVPVRLQAWKDFNPELIYGCKRNMSKVRAHLNTPGWQEVNAVQNHRIISLPCSVVCQVTPRVGAAIQFLAASIYPALMADTAQAVSSNGPLGEQPLSLDLDYVASAKVVTHRVNDADFKSLILSFKRPQAILSTIDGNRDAMQAVGNTYVPMHASLGHMAFGVDQVTADIATNLGYTTQSYSGLMTGANMDNLSLQVQREGGIEVVALVTAGVRGNAQRMSRDIGYNHPLGTINIIILTNHKLAPEGMARAIITATEAKTAALLDLDIRSTPHPLDYRATGTGTDSMILVQGEGKLVKYTGGHGKIGELIAKAVHAGVTEALSRQNGILAGRSLLQRLDERQISLSWLVEHYPSSLPPAKLKKRLAFAFSDPLVRSCIETVLALSDDTDKGLITDLQFFDQLRTMFSAHIAGHAITAPTTVQTEIPPLLHQTFALLVASVSAREDATKEK